MTDYESKARELLADALDAIGIRTTAVVSAAIESALASALRAAADETRAGIAAELRRGNPGESDAERHYRDLADAIERGDFGGEKKRGA